MTSFSGSHGNWRDNMGDEPWAPARYPTNGHATKESLRLLDTLQAMAAALQADTPPADLMTALSAGLCDATASDMALVRIVEPAGSDTLVIRGVHGLPQRLAAGLLGAVTVASDIFQNMRPGSFATVALRKDPRAAVLSTEEARELVELGMRHALILPLHHRGRLVGRLDLARQHNEPFSVRDRAVANMLSCFVASAIDETPVAAPKPAAETVDERVYEALLAFHQDIEPLSNAGEMLQSVVEVARSIVSSDRCYGLLWHETQQEFVPVAVSGADAPVIAALKNLSLSPSLVPALSRAMAGDDPIRISRAEAPDLLTRTVTETLGIESAVVVPLRGRHSTFIGALVLDRVTPGSDFSDHDIGILAGLAPQAAIMVENALLYEQVRRSSDSLALVNDIGIELASLTDPESLFAQVYRHVSSVIDASRFCIGLLLDDGESVEYRYAIADEIADEPVVYPLGEQDPLGYVIRTRNPILLTSRKPDDTSVWFPPRPDLSPAQSMLAVPVLVGRRVIGVVSAQSEMRNAYGEQDLELLTTIGMQTGVAIENARLYALVETRGERRGYLLDHVFNRYEAERKSLVDDIHNDTLQTLASSLYQIDRISRSIEDLGPERTKEELLAVRESLEQNIDRLRHMIFQIRPSTLDTLGLEAALREYLKHLERDTGIQTLLDVEMAERPSGSVETTLYRIIQEAVDTVRARPGVTRAVVRVRQRDDAIIITIADDSTTARTAALDDARPMTTDISEADTMLLTLKERAELAGGQFRLASRPTGGTALQITLPNRSST